MTCRSRNSRPDARRRGILRLARDAKLDRDVALKVLPEVFTSNPERLTRFEREAKVLASLNHPATQLGVIMGTAAYIAPEQAEGKAVDARVADFCDICPSDPENDADGDGICGDVDFCQDGELTDLVLPSGDISGEFSLCNSITNSGAVRVVEPGATLRAGLVALADGFSVASGAPLIVANGLSP